MSLPCIPDYEEPLFSFPILSNPIDFLSIMNYDSDRNTVNIRIDVSGGFI